MSNLWFNLMIWGYHIEIGDPNWYSIRISYNNYHKENNWPDGKIYLFTFKPFKY